MTFKVLLFNGNPVDESKLGSGIYASVAAKLRPNTATIESVENDYRQLYCYAGQALPSAFIENLSKCKLSKVRLTVVEE